MMPSQSVTSIWPDAWLINAARREPSDEDALNVLVERCWKPLYARCRMLTSDGDSARDLAEEAWLPVLRARHSLDADGHFQAHIMTVATNLWRDRSRASLRAGPMAEHRMSSLDASSVSNDEESLPLEYVLADPHTLSHDDRLLLEVDLDRALRLLEPRLRDVLVSRYVIGESAAEIGERHGRTPNEQSPAGFVRQSDK